MRQTGRLSWLEWHSKLLALTAFAIRCPDWALSHYPNGKCAADRAEQRDCGDGEREAGDQAGQAKSRLFACSPQTAVGSTLPGRGRRQASATIRCETQEGAPKPAAADLWTIRTSSSMRSLSRHSEQMQRCHHCSPASGSKQYDSTVSGLPSDAGATGGMPLPCLGRRKWTRTLNGLDGRKIKSS